MKIDFISNDNSEYNIKYVKRLLFFVITIIVIIGLKLTIVYDNSSYNELINNVNVVCVVMASVTCILFYDDKNKDEMFIMALLYISFAADLILGNIDNLSQKKFTLNQNTCIILINTTMRLFLFAASVLKLKKVRRVISGKKSLTCIVVVFSTIIFNYLESEVGFLKELKNSNFLVGYESILLVAGFVLVGIFIYRSIKEREYIYTILACSILLLGLKHVFNIVNICDSHIDLRVRGALLTSLSYIIVICGMFFQLKIKIEESKKLEENTMLFFNIINCNESNKVLIVNFEGEVMYCNETIRKRFIYSKDSKEIYTKLTVDFKERVRKIELQARNDIISILRRKKNWDGVVKVGKNEFIYRCNIQVINVDNKSKLVISYIDITEEYLAKKMLYESGIKFEALSKNVKDLIITLNEDGKIEYGNKAICEVMDYEIEELIGKKFEDYFTETAIFKKDNNSKDVIMENIIKRKDGTEVKFETIKSPIFDEENNIKGWILVARDIEYREAFECLKIKYKEIQNYQEIKNEFFANISHELRTPTNLIYSSLQLLNSNFENEDSNYFIESYDKYSGVLKQNCFRILKLINNLIDITKVEIGDMGLDLSNVNIVKVIEDITLSLVSAVKKKKINIIFDTDIEELEITCDKEKIERVILNLLSNAIKYTDKYGEILVHISYDKEWVKISVKDDGIGIPPEMNEVIFSRFVQVNKSFNRLKEGSGIGLALVKAIVELHEGKVYIEKNNGKGSEFVVMLPNYKKDVLFKQELIGLSKPIEEKIAIELSDIYDI